jgi:hypothetical protein
MDDRLQSLLTSVRPSESLLDQDDLLGVGGASPDQQGDSSDGPGPRTYPAVAGLGLPARVRET